MAIGVSLQEDAASGLGQVNSAISTASGGIGVAGTGAGAMRGDAASMRSQARLVNTQGMAINRDADALSALVPKLDPYAQKLGNLGDQLAGIGSSLSEQAKDVFGQGSALVRMDQSAGGLAGEFVKYWNTLSPDRYVAQAASDAQGAIQNQTAQAERDLSRRGVSASSGAFAGLRRTAATAAAALVARAKTIARQQGLDHQAAQLDKMVSAANTLYNMGRDTQSAATAALGQAGDMQKGAAGVVQTQGGLLGDAGKLRATAGQLFGSAASIFGDAAGIEGSAANLELSALKNLQAAQLAAADYYGTVMRVASGVGGGGGGVTVQSSPSSGDDWFNWKGTGHSETWNKNHNPNFESMIG